METFDFSEEDSDSVKLNQAVLKNMFEHFTVLFKLFESEELSPLIKDKQKNLLFFTDSAAEYSLFNNENLEMYIEMYDEALRVFPLRRNPYFSRKSFVVPLILAASSDKKGLVDKALRIIKSNNL